MNYLAQKISLPILFSLLFIVDFGWAQNKAASRPAPPPDARGLVASISVTGERKIEEAAILEKLTTYVGGPYSPTWIKSDVRRLFDLGYFYNIEVLREGSGDQVGLTYRVTEKPSIAEIEFQGNSEIESSELKDAGGLKNFEILDYTKINEATAAIAKIYEDKGFFLARVSYEVEEIAKDETVRLIFKIEENAKVAVKQITIIGNEKIKDGELKSRLMTQEGGFFSFISGSGAYKQDAFDRDMQILKFLYFNQGYIQVKIDRPEVYVTPDKKSIYISIRVEEGDQFKVGKVDFTGDLLFSKEEMFKDIGIDEREVFSWEQVQLDIATLTAKYGDLGYAFANVIPRTPLNEKEQTVDLIFDIDRGNKVRFGEINIIGNDKTRDNVIRRELKVFEGELYHETRKRESVANVQRLGFFEEVNFRTSTPPGSPDVLNIDVVVKERSTGTIQLGAGYSSTTKLNFSGQVNQPNFLGKGQSIAASLSITSETSLYNLKITDPYFMGTTWLAGVEGYRLENRSRPYIEEVTGGAVRIGHPLGEYLQASLRYKYDVTELSEREGLTDQAIHPLDTGSGSTSSITGVVEYDTRNDRFSPSGGQNASLSLEYAGLGGDLKYTKGIAAYRYFYNVFWDVVWRNNLTYGVVESHDGGAPPFNELFLLGGPYSLRGYRTSWVGRRVYSEKFFNEEKTRNPSISDEEARKKSMIVYGGSQQLYLSTELEFPLIREAQIKGVIFYDIGQAEDTIDPSLFFADVGFGFRWFSPIGPLRFEWGFPIGADSFYHESPIFEFSIGSPF